MWQTHALDSLLFAVFRTLSVFSSRTCRLSNFHRKFATKKNHQIFQTCISWGFRALFVKQLFKLFFRFRLVTLLGWGGVGGGDDNVPWTCTHVWCYANWWLRDVTLKGWSRTQSCKMLELAAGVPPQKSHQVAFSCRSWFEQWYVTCLYSSSFEIPM